MSVRLSIELSDEQLAQIAERAAMLAKPADCWLDTKGAAAHLACKPDRVHDLVALDKLRPRRDGRRLLFKRSELDAYIEGQ